MCRLRSGCLLVGFFLAPAISYGQSVKEHTTETVEPRKGESAAAGKNADLARVKDRILQLTNQFRKQRGRGPLKANDELNQAAQYFADFMARTDKYGHTADGKEPWERLAKQDYAYCIVLENIAYEYGPSGFRSDDLARVFMDGWKQSPPHRKNLLDPDIDDIGIGVGYSSRTGRYYAVQDFARPKSKEIVFRITNETDSRVEYTLDGKKFTIDPRYTITYERCRPPELQFQAPKGAAAVSPKMGTTFHPRKDDHYVIRKDESGALTVEKG